MKKEKFITELKEIIQSSNINFLFGAGISTPFLPILGNIEKVINKAIEDNKPDEQILAYKKYIETVMTPSQKIFSGKFLTKVIKDKMGKALKNLKGKERTEKIDFEDTKNSYSNFIETITKLILERETTILNKQVNIFTTNIDPLFEKTIEDLFIDYNDGFSGRLNPSFSLSNFKKSFYQRSLHFDHKSEIPIFNIFKIHGSLTWKYEDKPGKKSDRKILLSNNLSNVKDSLLTKEGKEFMTEYKENILVVNPENAKFSETVLNKYYYELLRIYSDELERENSVLFVIGFSMDDQHIQEITKRAAKSNPTLRIFIFLHSKKKRTEIQDKMETTKFPNITIVSNEYEGEKNDYIYDLDTVTEKIFKLINIKPSKHEQ